MSFLIYGATGYTGKLVAEAAKAQGLSPILAGRNEEKLRAVAEPLDFVWRVFGLDDREKLHAALGDVQVVLHIAGPFSATSKPMADACVATGTHYLDITGEIDVFEALAARDAEAKGANVMLMPGVGFDVVPSDCLAAHMKTRLPDANSLNLVIAGLGHMSRGTAKSGAEAIGKASRVRRDGAIVDLSGSLYEDFTIGNETKHCVAVSWGDVSTAYHSTGIGNITVYFEATKQIRQMVAMPGALRWFLSTGLGQRFIKAQIDKQPEGPTDAQRAQGRAVLLAIAANADGEVRSSLLTTPEGYTLTAMTSLEAVRRILAGHARPGFQTPSRVFRAEFITGFDGCRMRDL